jgi:GT2 family glycosyltransferase
MFNITVLIPSYNRSDILKLTIDTWLRADDVKKIIILAQATREEELNEYKKIKKSLEMNRDLEILFICIKKKLGSINARNMLIKLANDSDSQFILMIDDDYVLPNSKFLRIMAKYFEYDNTIGAVGGRVVMFRKRRVDPDFFLNAPILLADPLTRLTSYIFLDVNSGPRFAEYLTPFFMVRKEILGSIAYDKLLEAPSGFREESDLQKQIKMHGYQLLFDPNVYVVHLAPEEGGNRPRISMGERIYWKARNHTIFILKWYKSVIKRIWFLLASLMLLIAYRPWHIHQILKGVKEGLNAHSYNFTRAGS